MNARCRIADHRPHWEQHLLPGLIDLYNQAPMQDWTVDEVREQLDAGRALLVIDEDDPNAFAVVRLDSSPYRREAPELELFVQLARHAGGNAIAEFQPHLEEIAHCAGARCIRFYSCRRGMTRLAATAGYSPRWVEFVKEL